MMDECCKAEAPEKVDTDSLVNLAYFLEGFKAARGNILPMGTITLENLWLAIKQLRLIQMEKDKLKNS